uniref:Uncharacterized protein n=1 Tax=Avena sativa TaxID=4498 RepID=A0ACD5UA47_AVESA
MALPEYVQVAGQAPLPVAWLEGDVLAEYVRFLEEVEEKAPVTGPGGVKPLEGDVLAEFLRFLGEENPAVEDYGSSSGGNSADYMDEEDESYDDEMKYMLRHIMTLPAVMARVAAAASVQQ